ncbi:D-aminoacyl-tRNA deacylase [Propionispora hippei]|uniref:D-aminoacyl-tRNA deacylase n=1 Tax=Propionispora hippei DSM 15287 TaxID=1123003 RepID=A0A1M6AIZ8_9FIRM|nr:D-aminoacyl-tRNA deacylase [Propionispora hippei]SHI36460.1 D-tyrosyl-tRNA(Tyr) deacylase [Propionispora hippei DSM 15287]
MRAVVQLTDKASVVVNGQTNSQIDRGLTVLLGVEQEDTLQDVRYLAEKIVNLRIFPDPEGKMNLSLLDIRGELLVVSQFTLLGDCRKGRRPSFSTAAPPGEANELYEVFVKICSSLGVRVGTGQFQAEMIVTLANHGPVTLLLDSKRTF